MPQKLDQLATLLESIASNLRKLAGKPKKQEYVPMGTARCDNESQRHPITMRFPGDIRKYRQHHKR